MKLNSYLVLLAVFMGACKKKLDFAEIYSKITDANFEYLLVQNGVDSEGLVDGKIRLSDVVAAERLDFSYYTPPIDVPSFIIGLDDIKLFQNLTYLSLAGSFREPSFNLSGNLKLDTLIMSGTSISNINLHENKNLKALYLGSMKLDTLILGRNDQVRHIEIQSVPLRYLEIGPRVEKLIVRGTKLKTIDLSEAALLSYIDAEDSFLTEMDLSGCGRLDFVNLTYNYLRSLKLPVHLCQDVVITDLHLEKNRNYLKEICVCNESQANSNLNRKLYIPYNRWDYAWTTDEGVIFKECK